MPRLLSCLLLKGKTKRGQGGAEGMSQALFWTSFSKNMPLWDEKWKSKHSIISQKKKVSPTSKKEEWAGCFKKHYLTVTQFSGVNHKQITFCWTQCFMLPHYLVQFLQRKVFEFKQQQVEERKEIKQERLPANQQNLGEVLHMEIKRRGGEYILKKKCQKW